MAETGESMTYGAAAAAGGALGGAILGYLAARDSHGAYVGALFAGGAATLSAGRDLSARGQGLAPLLLVAGVAGVGMGLLTAFQRG